MCGRFSIINDVEELEKRFNIKINRNQYKKNDNASPTQNLPVICNENPDILSFFRWGLLPFWSKENDKMPLMINSKCETIFEKPAFRNSIKSKRCLVPASSFYEWKKEGKSKIQYEIGLKDFDLFCMAGIWDLRKNQDGSSVYSFSILTTSANELVSEIHDRMPVILHQSDEIKWLSPDCDPRDFFQSYTSELMKAEIYNLNIGTASQLF